MSRPPNEIAIRPTIGQPGPTSTITIGTEESSSLTIEHGVSIQITYDVAKFYVIGILEDKSKAMIATFTRETKDPFPSIQEWLEENFNPGPSAAAKTNRASIIFFLWKPASDESAPISRDYLGMINNITIFRLHSYGIVNADAPNIPHTGIMSLNLSPEFTLIMGDAFHKMVNLPPGRH